LIFSCSIGFGQNYNRPVPAELFSYEFQTTTNSSPGYFLTSNFKVNILPSNPAYISPYPVIYDENGYLAWYAKPDLQNSNGFQYYPEADLFSYGSVEQGQNRKFIVLDGNLNRIDTLNTIGHAEDMHDFQRAANGNWLLSVRFMDTMDLSAYTFDGVQGSAQTIIRGYGVQEIDPQGNLVFEWNSNDHMHPTETYDFYGYNVNDFDYCHGNAIEEDDDGNLLFSMRHTNSVIKVDRTTGDIIWRLGGQLSDFTFPNSSGFSAQHDIRRLSNGNYSIYNNDNMGPQISTAHEYLLDTVSWTATQDYNYAHPDGNYHRSMGSYRRLDNDYKVIGWGFSYRPAPTATLVDDQDEILSEFYFEDSVMVYRMFFDMDVTLPRPEITCVDTGNGFELTIDPASSYQWSTGETTQSIAVTTAGTYQVWVPHGEGFIGSLPFTVMDPNAPCTAGLEELLLDHGNFRWFNLMGQEIEHLEEGHLYLKIYDSGLIEKVIFRK
ncbi:arylsulfotransferase family protein, partial [Crocinitomicaceae bacterium]|nr:arylsulfotransferase family protein [Crocinitomicaceae bacterium]